MSTDEQEYSLENQRAAIFEYAQKNGFEIVRTYEDPGESGLDLKLRGGLRRLLADVTGGEAKYRKIIVLDVSRWGRFQDADEAAHYEFVCKQAGIGVLYCAETFNSESTALQNYLAKVLKRTLAAEYSRELSVRVFDNHKRAVQLGFRVGGQPGYGLSRMAVSRDGSHKGILQTGEFKALMTDHVTLVHGPDDEVECIRTIFSLCVRRKTRGEIVSELNRRGMKNAGRPWKAWMIDRIISNPKYAGSYVWNRRSRKLHALELQNKPEDWIVEANAFPPIVSEAVFNKARLRIKTVNRWSDSELLGKLRRLLKRKGSLSERLIQKSGMPSLATFHRRFGTFDKIYKLVDFNPPPGRFSRSTSRQRTQSLRVSLFQQITALFPGQTRLFHHPRKTRQILELGGLKISVLICPQLKNHGRSGYWSLLPVAEENQYLTLVCRLNSHNDTFHSFHLFRAMNKHKGIRFTEQYPWLLQGEQLRDLNELFAVAKRLQPARFNSAEHSLPLVAETFPHNPKVSC